jgi:hypothetical protein
VRSGPNMRGGVEASDCDMLCEGVRSIDMEVFGVSTGPEVRTSLVCVGRKFGESGWRTEPKLRRTNDLRGEALRRGREPLVESKLPLDMPCRQVMMRSLGGCVDTLSLREWLVRDSMLLGRPILEPALLSDDVSHASLIRMRLANAQSCLKTFMAPV